MLHLEDSSARFWAATRGRPYDTLRYILGFLLRFWAATRGRPYDCDNAVKMIWHNDVFVQGYGREF